MMDWDRHDFSIAMWPEAPEFLLSGTSTGHLLG